MSTEDNEKREGIDLTGKTPEEILALASECGHELTEEELREISGGKWIGKDTECPNCGSTNTMDLGDGHFLCKDCHYKWWW